MKKESLKFWILYHVGIVIFSILAGALMKYRQTGGAFDPETIMKVSTILIVSLLTGYFAIYLTHRSKKIPHDKLTKRIVPGFLIFLGGTFIIANLVVTIGVFILYVVHGKDMSNFIPNLFKYELNFSNSSLLIWFMVFAIAFFYVLWKKSAKKEQELREEKLKYQYQTLKAQINPHFLFNSFNALSELVYEDPERADRYIQRLSGIYRYILENEENKLIPVEDEIKFVEEYFDLQKERDMGKISLEIDFDGIKDLMVIPVSLQLLVENAVKHNSKSKANPLVIKITKEDEHIVVSNNILRKNKIENSTKLGLDNLKDRTKLILDKDLIVSQEGNKFIVKLPITNCENESFNY